MELPVVFQTFYVKGNDFAGLIFVKNVIDNLNAIEEKLHNYTINVSSLYDLYDYFWLQDFLTFSNDVAQYSGISDNDKKRVINISKEIRFDIKSLICFVNNNYEEIFNKNNIEEPMYWFRFFPKMLELCYGVYSAGFDKSVFDFLEKNYNLNILSSFDVCYKHYQKKEFTDNFKKLFLPLKETETFDDYIYKDFLLKNTEIIDCDFLKSQADFICKRAYEKILAFGLDSENKDIIEIAHYFDDYYKVACLYRLQCANNYSTYKPKIDSCLNDYIHKHGQHIDFGPIDLTPGINILKSNKNPLVFLQLTHKLVDGRIINNFDDIKNEKPNNVLTELFNGNPKSEKYPYYKQDAMKMNMGIQISLLHYILVDKELSVRYHNYVANICSHVQHVFFQDMINIFDEIMGAYEIINNLISLNNEKNGDSIIAKALYNSCCVNLCGTLEKIVRNIVVKEESANKFLEEKYLTLGNLSDFKLESLSYGIKYYMEYYLITDKNASPIKVERPGLDIRNIQMHNNNDKYNKTGYELCLTLFHLENTYLI